MKQKVYLETTIISYLTARKPKNLIVAGHQESTKSFWRRLADFSPFISDLVVQEAGRGNQLQAQARLNALKSIPILETDMEVKKMAEILITHRAVPKEYPEDAIHIAVAIVNGMDFLVTWNMAHINNPFTRMMIRQAAEYAGYIVPEICSPEELLGGSL